MAASISLSDIPKRFDLTKRFAALSFICIALFAAALCWVVARYLENEMLDREGETTAQYIRGETRRNVSVDDFKSADPKSVESKFDQLQRHITAMPDITRLKFYNGKGVIIWSDEKRLVGSKFQDNDELEEALEGKVVTDISDIEKQENVFERGAFQRLAEVYVPIFSDDGKEVVGVIESYKSVETLLRDVRRARFVIVLVSIGAGLLLYLSLFFIVRQAARKIAEQQENLIDMQAELIASQRMAAVGEVAAAVAHGIGNPLSSIRAAAQLAKLDCRDCEGAHLQQKTIGTLDSIMQQVDRVQRRMRGLLNFTRPLEPDFAPVDINKLLTEAVEVLRPRYHDNGVDARLDLGGGLPVLRLDVNHMEQVFQGLLTNAVEATPKGGSVTVSTRLRPGSNGSAAVVIAVDDTGDGIPPENRERVFEPFFTTKPTGTGIGLPLAKKFIERNGGAIAISDGASGGTRVEVTFPLLQAG
jgi:two-component system, NtrC family, sensor histidine kinase HydH